MIRNPAQGLLEIPLKSYPTQPKDFPNYDEIAANPAEFNDCPNYTKIKPSQPKDCPNCTKLSRNPAQRLPCAL